LDIIFCNCSPGEAEGLARTLVSERLAACVNVIPGARSFYEWDGALQDDQECMLLIKTTTERVAALSRRIRELHSYDTPEVVVVPVDVERSDPRYLSWVRQMTRETA
jgi:periplasmic divalent cation tolerance protein